LYPSNWKEISKEARTMWKQAIDEVKGPAEQYKKNITLCFNEDGEITFQTTIYKRGRYIRYKKTEDLVKDNDENHYFFREDLEKWKVIDLGKYTKLELLHMIREFLL